ncbi:hypothetical protein KY316_03165, partial [Candidatus Woesearchaeota archaeon]|nr:hypothetical protein [Candidatus Woesearchaeota archaeon]
KAEPEKDEALEEKLEKSFNSQDIVEIHKQLGLVGEEYNAFIQTIAACKKMHFGYVSLSGSGKSFSAKILLKLLPSRLVYSMALGSDKAEIRNDKEINKCELIYTPELNKALDSNQKKNNTNVEVLKTLLEGEDASRKVWNQSKGKNEVNTIKAGKGFFFTIAVENAFKYDKEFSRRIFILQTDVSSEQTKKI